MNKTNATARLALGALAFGLPLALATGCLVGPNFTRPAQPGVQSYLPAESAAPPGTPVAGPQTPESAAVAAQHIALGEQIPAQWWGLFHSARLDATLRQAIAANYTLVSAQATLAAAEEAIVAARGALLPQASVAAAGRRGTGTFNTVSNLFSVGPSASYSIDAFGGTRRHVEQEAALADNQRYQLAAAWLTLTGNTVTEAIAVASTRLQIATVEDLIKNDQKNLDLTQREFDAGKVARSDVLTAAAQLENDRTQLPPLHQQLSVARHAMAVLVGRPAGEWAPPDFDLDELTLPDSLPISLPSELVRQRPDILAAEANLHADSAAIGVATAQLYPSITLSASLVQQALSLATLFNAASRTWSVGGAVNAPLYTGGILQAQKRAAIDVFNAQLATYEQTVLTAFDQVADALSALQHDAELVAVSRRAVDIASASLQLQRSSYAAGKTSALQLIAAEDTYSQARLGYVRALGERMTDSAQLLIAAGGGWWNDADLAAQGRFAATGNPPATGTAAAPAGSAAPAQPAVPPS
jgi:NodT family efflux transporter outer membrane factor (OMF) lipoprotein